MNKKFIIFLGAILGLIASISFAAILSYYGKIIGTATVESPEFYIGSATDETLLINEKSPNCAYFFLEDNYTRAFITEENLGGIDFSYIPKARFSVRAHITGGIASQDLTLRFGYIGDNDPITICEANVSVNHQMANYTTEFIECLNKPVGVRKIYYEMKGNCEDCKYIIGKCVGGFYTKVKLSK